MNPESNDKPIIESTKLEPERDQERHQLGRELAVKLNEVFLSGNASAIALAIGYMDSHARELFVQQAETIANYPEELEKIMKAVKRGPE